MHGKVVLALVATTLLAGVLTAVAGAAPIQPPGPFAAKPLPVDANGVPLVADEAMNTLGPGQDVLVAVKPAGSSYWYRPSDVGAEQDPHGGEYVKMASPPTRPNPTGGVSPFASETVGSVFGCTANRWPPDWFQANYELQGGEDFLDCTGLGHTTASVRVKESSTYGTHASLISGHDGNTFWTAYSDFWTCEPITRSWQTVATNIYTDPYGNSGTFTNTSQWEAGITC
jgi:hypothetical protein